MAPSEGSGMQRLFTPTVALTVATGLVFVLWTYLTFDTTVLAGLDATSLTPAPSLSTAHGQISAAISFALGPWIPYIALGVTAIWAWRRRLRNIAWGFVLTVALAWGSGSLLKNLIERPRPATHADLITADGFSYPSAHVIGMATLVVAVSTLFRVTRRTGPAIWAAQFGLFALWAIVAYNRWDLRAHYITDIIAGTLWGGFVASISLLVSGVRVVAPWAGRARVGVPPLVTVIVNPVKVTDWGHLRQQVDAAARQHGWGRPRWRETTPEDTGAGVARRAVEAGADLILVAGGDGTVRAAAEGLAGSKATLALLPSGTANLLARNLGIPLDLADALETAFDGTPSPLDLIELRADDGEPVTAVVMAGVGLDAAIMSETNADLKRAVGSVAYMVSAVSALGRPGFSLTTTVDEHPAETREVGIAIVANVGMLQAGIQLLPNARADDGLLDLLCAEASGPVAWAGLAGQVVTRASNIGGLVRDQGRRIVLEMAEPIAYEADGDTLGTCSRLEARIVAGAARVMLPREGA